MASAARRSRSAVAAASQRRPPKPVEYNILLTATLCLLAAGAVMVYSASSARTLLEGQGDGTAYLVKYLVFGAAGLVLLQLLARSGLEFLPRVTPGLLASRSSCSWPSSFRASASRSTARGGGSAPGRCSSSRRSS